MPSGRAIGQDLLNVPMGDMIRQMALAIAEAQLALDESGIRQAELMSGQVVLRNEEGQLIDEAGNPSTIPHYYPSTVSFGYRVSQDTQGNITTTPEKVSMMELGFTPTFYQFIDTVIEVKIAIKMTEESATERKEKGYRRCSTFSATRNGVFYGTSVTPVDASYSSKYNYSAEGSSVLRTKLVPVPPPSILEERARMLMQQNEADRKAERDKAMTAVSSTNGPAR
jgi:hypothetical protein